MNPLLNYVIQVIIVSGLLYSYYHWVLRNKKFHRYNRYYLLGAAVSSILIPLLNIPVYFTEEEATTSIVYSTLNVFTGGEPEEAVVVYANTIDKSSWFTSNHILQLIYILVATLVLLRIIFSLLKIRRIVHRHTVEQIGRIRFMNTDEPGTPYSFFRWLFWNRKIDLHSEKGEQIFRHELFHIEQKHSLDILFLELLTVVGWFNPFFHFMKRETKAIHEFLADQFAVNENNRWNYAELLLMQVLNTNQRLVHPFFHNQIKRRIAMITSPQKTSHQYLRKLMVLPVTAVAVLLFAFSYKEKTLTDLKSHQNDQSVADTSGQPGKEKFIEVPIGPNSQIKSVPLVFKNNAENTATNLENAILIINSKQAFRSQLQNKFIESDSVVVYSPGDKEAIRLYGTSARNGVIIFYNAKITDRPAPAQETVVNKIFDKVEIEASFPGGMDAWRKYLERNLNAEVPIKEKAPKGTYTVMIQFVVNLDGSLSDLRALTNHGYGMETEAIRAIEKGPKWLAAIQNGRQVNSYRKQPITFVVDNGPRKESKINAGQGTTLNEVVMVGYSEKNTADVKSGNKEITLYNTTQVKNSKTGYSLKLAADELYIGIENIFRLEAPGIDLNELVAEITPNGNAELRKDKLIINVNAISERHLLSLYKTEGNKKSLLKTIQFKVRTIPLAEIEKSSGTGTAILTSTPEISVSQLKTITACEALGLPAGTEVISYNFTIDRLTS